MLFLHLLASKAAAFHGVAEGELLLATALQDDLLQILRQFFKGFLNVKLVVLGHRFKHREIVAIAPIPSLDGTAGQRKRRKSHDPARVKKLHRAQTIAGLASTHGRIE